jgi:hypothetical protein
MQASILYELEATLGVRGTYLLDPYEYPLEAYAALR